MSKEKILLVSCEGLGKGGVQLVLMNAVRMLSHKYTFDIILFTDEKRYYDDEFESYGGKIIRIPFYNGNSRFLKKADYYIRGFRICKRIKKAISENGPYKAIHANSAYESALSIKAAAKCGIPVRLVHNHVICGRGRILSRIVDGIYMKIIKKDATLFAACSEKSYVSMFGEDKKFVIPNPFDKDRFSPKLPYEQQRKFEITQVANFYDWKNQLFTVEVLAEIFKKYPDAKLNFVGAATTPYRYTVEKRVNELGLTDNVVFHDFNADIPEILDNSAAFILSSINEPFGIVLIEAQAMGVRCYAPDTTSRATDMGGCTYMPLEDGAKKWADRIIEDYEKYQGKHIKCDCSRYDPQKVANLFDDIYSGKI